jgi:hypothetical protein
MPGVARPLYDVSFLTEIAARTDDGTNETWVYLAKAVLAAKDCNAKDQLMRIFRDTFLEDVDDIRADEPDLDDELVRWETAVRLIPRAGFVFDYVYDDDDDDPMAPE